MTDRSCSNCKYLVQIMKHPWNKGVSKGDITEPMGWGCSPPEFSENNIQKIVFFDSIQIMCEMHEFKENK